MLPSFLQAISACISGVNVCVVALWDVSSNATISIGAIIKAAAAPKMIIQKKIRAKNNLNREPRILNILAFSFTE